MNYILYNPKSNNENNDLNIVPGRDELTRRGVKDVCLLDLDVAEFCRGLEENDRVFICGGDGTLHHFVNKLGEVTVPCPLFVIRSGTGNDFLNDIGQKDNSSLIDIREYINNLPVGEVNGKTRRFINGVGFGLDGEVCLGVEEFKKKTNRKANYTTIALKLLMFSFKRPSARVTVDGVTKEYSDVWAISTMHGKYYGGGLMVAPTQDRNSGKLSVMVMHGGTRLKALTLFARLSDGGHIKCKEIVEIIEGDEVLVESDSPCALQMDGEVEVDVTAYSARSAAAVRREAQEAATQKTAAEV